jgi:hypothetical protein
VCCASVGADRPECGICADPAYVVIPQEKKKKRLYLWKFLGAAFLLGLCSVVCRNLAFLQHRQMAYYMKDGAAG